MSRVPTSADLRRGRRSRLGPGLSTRRGSGGSPAARMENRSRPGRGRSLLSPSLAVDLLVGRVHVGRAAGGTLLRVLPTAVAEDLPTLATFLQIHPAGTQAGRIMSAIGASGHGALHSRQANDGNVVNFRQIPPQPRIHVNGSRRFRSRPRPPPTLLQGRKLAARHSACHAAGVRLCVVH